MPADVVRRALRAIVLVLFALAVVDAARAQPRAGSEPGRFDFYVLALSWSPSYCAALRERGGEGAARTETMQCGARPFSFVVHGLWPQFEQGFPLNCQQPAPRIPRSLVETMLDLMPSPRLVYVEWDRHGTCSGLGPAAYFEAVRKARAAVQIPHDYARLSEPTTVSPDEVVEAFVKANPSLPREAVAVTCDRTRLSEVRICMRKDLSFRACPDSVRRTCRQEKVAIPAVRGG